mgnify:CR=1 FL=1
MPTLTNVHVKLVKHKNIHIRKSTVELVAKTMFSPDQTAEVRTLSVSN